MMRALLLILLLPFSNLHAQDLQLDSDEMSVRVKSIREILTREKSTLHDTIVADYYLQLAEYSALNFDFAIAISICDSVLIGYSKLDFYKRKEVEEQKALYLLENGKTDEAMKILLKILREFEEKKDIARAAELNKKIGVFFLKGGDLMNAEYHLTESIKQAKETNQYELEGYANMSLGNRFKRENRFEEAEKHFKISASIAKKHELKRLLAGNYNNVGSLMRKMNQLDQSIYYYKMAMEINMEIGNDRWLSYNYNNMGNLLLRKKSYSEALEYFNLSLEIKNRLGDLREKVATILNISEAYEGLGNYREAHEYHKLYKKLGDSVAKMDEFNASKRLAAEFQAEKREAEIAQLKMQDELNRVAINAKDDEKSYNKVLTWTFGGLFILTLIIAVVVWRGSSVSKKVNSELKSMSKELDGQHREIVSGLNYAKRIQNSLLPSAERLKELLVRYAVLHRPREKVSGDFYLCDKVGDRTMFGLADCTGIGVSGAMMSIIASSKIEQAFHQHKISDPGEVLAYLNEELPKGLNTNDQNFNDGLDISLCALDSGSMRLYFSGAKLNCWIINSKESINYRTYDKESTETYLSNNHHLIELKGDRRGIAKTSGTGKFATREFELVKGDLIVLATDGFANQFGGPKHKKYKSTQMRELIMELGGSTPERLMNVLGSSFEDWMGEHEQVDDVCVFAVKV